MGFVTDAERPLLTPDDRLAVPALAAHGLAVVPVVWTEPLPAVDALVLRSTWDYHLRLPEFLEWIAGVERRAIPLHNSPATVRWNVDKLYLLEIEARGVPIVPTRHLRRGSGARLSEVLRDACWTEAVVKPSVSGGAFQTWRGSAGAEHDTRFARQLEAMDCLVQPFVPELLAGGEWSLLYFGGRFSHAVLKRPASGDFRVQEEFGGVVVPARPSAEIVSSATRALAAAGHPTLYARVDGVVRAGRLEILELELVEPSLFLESSPGAAARFARALSDVLR